MFEKIIECRQCNKEFSVKYYAKDQASYAACNRKYCSSKCKKLYLKFNGTKNSIKLQCEECEIIYYKPPSLSKNSRFCSRECANKKYSDNNRQERKTNKCLLCGKSYEVIHSSTRQYCGLPCARLASRTAKRVEYSCEVCGKSFPGLESDPRRFCTRRCQYAGQSAGLVKIPTNGRTGIRIDLPKTMRFKSSLEADYARYCTHIGKEYLYESRTFEITLPSGKIKRYTPDFYHPDSDEYVETKARRKDKKYETNLESLFILGRMGYNVRVVYMNEFYSDLRTRGLYEEIDNLERRNYKKTRHLIVPDS